MPEANATDEVVVPDVNAADEAAADAEMEAGFSGAVDTPTGETPPVETPAEPTPAAREVKVRQVSEDEWVALTTKAAEIDQIRADVRRDLDRAFGKVGGLERTLATLQATTPSGLALEVTDDTVAELAKEFPELGSLTLQAFKRFASQLKGTATAAQVDPAQVSALVAERTAALQAETLDEEHEGWREVVGSKESNTAYRQWLAKQPADYQQKLETTQSAAVIGRSITKFNEAIAAEKAIADKAAAEKAAAEKAAADKAAAANTRRNRLETSVPQRGASGASPSNAEDDFEAGFNSGPAGQKPSG